MTSRPSTRPPAAAAGGRSRPGAARTSRIPTTPPAHGHLGEARPIEDDDDDDDSSDDGSVAYGNQGRRPQPLPAWHDAGHAPASPGAFQPVYGMPGMSQHGTTYVPAPHSDPHAASATKHPDASPAECHTATTFRWRRRVCHRSQRHPECSRDSSPRDFLFLDTWLELMRRFSGVFWRIWCTDGRILSL